MVDIYRRNGSGDTGDDSYYEYLHAPSKVYLIIPLWAIFSLVTLIITS